ncbi:hypothetical protein [Streptomyces niveus]|uniref:hypothetical protein n=1 Tax=Streptomyces niveus TaxID=193462 RepID=UPI0035D7FE13
MAGPTSPILRTDAQPRVEYSQFLLADDESLPEFPGWKGSSRVLVEGDRGVLFRTAGNDFFPDVRIEVWSSEPHLPQDQVWDVIEEAAIVSQTGRIRLREWDRSPAGELLRLGSTGDCRLRAHCRGRAEATARSAQDLFYEGAEEWLLQIWPIAPSD